jgi:hypothetical protein
MHFKAGHFQAHFKFRNEEAVRGRTYFLNLQLASDILPPWPQSASALYRPSDRRLSAKLVQTFATWSA